MKTENKIGMKICVNPLPAYDINENDYDCIGSGGTIIKIDGDDLIIELFDGAIIKVPNESYDLVSYEVIMNVEKIKCAAIRYRILGESEDKIVTGYNHAQCLEWFFFINLYPSKRDMDREVQGFMTDTNKFVNRQMPYVIAKNNDQLRYDRGRDYLTSEDVEYCE